MIRYKAQIAKSGLCCVWLTIIEGNRNRLISVWIDSRDSSSHAVRLSRVQAY